MPPFSVYLNNAARFLLHFFLRKIPGAVYVCPSVVLIQEGTKSSWVLLDHWGKAAEQKICLFPLVFWHCTLSKVEARKMHGWVLNY